MLMACAMLFFTGAIYDSGDKLMVEPYFFQPNNLSSDRVGLPKTPTELGDAYMHDALIRRFVTEYFYVIPDAENIARRMTTSNANPLAHLSAPMVFKTWLENTAPKLQEMVTENQLRLVRFTNDPNTPDIVYNPINEYYQIFYQLHTWTTPNALITTPIVTNHTMFIKFEERPGITPDILKYGVHRHLDKYGDPIGLFRFKVTDVILK